MGCEPGPTRHRNAIAGNPVYLQPQRVELKGATNIPRQAITLCFVGYPSFTSRLHMWGAASILLQPQAGKSQGKSGVLLALALGNILTPIGLLVHAMHAPLTKLSGHVAHSLSTVGTQIYTIRFMRTVRTVR